MEAQRLMHDPGESRSPNNFGLFDNKPGNPDNYPGNSKLYLYTRRDNRDNFSLSELNCHLLTHLYYTQVTSTYNMCFSACLGRRASQIQVIKLDPISNN